jgi:hypothetical protein
MSQRTSSCLSSLYNVRAASLDPLCGVLPVGKWLALPPSDWVYRSLGALLLRSSGAFQERRGARNIKGSSHLGGDLVGPVMRQVTLGGV